MDKTGQNRVKADYLMLRTLQSFRNDTVNLEDLKGRMDEMAEELERQDIDSPIKFSPTVGPVQLQSRAFNRSLHRCRDIGFIDQEGQQLSITEDGFEFVDNGDYKNTEEIREFIFELDRLFEQLS